MAEIYGLFSARDGIVRYVGQTVGVCADRFEQHKRDAATERAQRRLCEWLHDEWLHGYPVECALLELCSEDVRHQRETQWISSFPKLLNKRKQYGWDVGKPPKVPDITAYMRRYLPNAGGFRGIRWDRHWDLYQVLIYTGHGVEWLFGDEAYEMTGLDGNMYFPDRTAALIARDKVRQYGSVMWLPDIESEV